MITIKGKYNSANIMTDVIDEETMRQIYSFLNHPAFAGSYIAVMPDCHAGAGAVIGFTMKMNEYIIANVIGVDIGCGVLTYNIGQMDIDLNDLDIFIRENIPSGFAVNNKPIKCDKKFLDVVEQISVKIGSDYGRNIRSLGTLGGGNHFWEIGVDENGDKWITVHSGSRKFGLDIANYHQNKAKALMRQMFIGDAYKNLEFLPIDDGGQEYLDDMKIAQQFACINRNMMVSKVIEYLGVDVKQKIESVHNYIDFTDNIIRKGAIKSYEGESLVIPFNMEDGLIIGVGKSNKKWNYSAPHGAGRVLSRKKAKAVLDLEEVKRSMNERGIFTTSLCQDTLDESKKAYKDKDLILSLIDETVEVLHYVKPIYNFKAK